MLPVLIIENADVPNTDQKGRKHKKVNAERKSKKR
jgi:hypothetical protein